MMIIDTVKKFGYTQWIEEFVSDVLANANINAAVTYITDLDNKRFYLMVDGREYMIRTKNYFPVKRDQNGLTCSEVVEYDLHIGHEYCEFPEDPISLNTVSSGTLDIEWSNDIDILKAEYEQDIALHGTPKKLDAPDEGGYMMLHVTDLNDGYFDLKADIRPLSADELNAVASYFTYGELDEAYNTPKMRRYLNSIHEACIDGIIRFCFEDEIYDHKYTQNLIEGCALNKLCCTDCASTEYSILEKLHEKYLNGNEAALNIIKANLNEFFRNIAPYSITIE